MISFFLELFLDRNVRQQRKIKKNTNHHYFNTYTYVMQHNNRKAAFFQLVNVHNIIIPYIGLYIGKPYTTLYSGPSLDHFHRKSTISISLKLHATLATHDWLVCPVAMRLIIS